MIYHKCDLCNQECKPESVFVSIESRFVDSTLGTPQMVKQKHEQEFCDKCSTKIKDFLNTTKNV